MDIYNQLLEENKVNNNELYLIQDDESFNPEVKTNDQTQSVGIDSNGKLWTAPGVFIITATKNENETNENNFSCTVNHTFTEMLYAYRANRDVWIIYENDILKLTGLSDDSFAIFTNNSIIWNGSLTQNQNPIIIRGEWLKSHGNSIIITKYQVGLQNENATNIYGTIQIPTTGWTEVLDSNGNITSYTYFYELIDLKCGHDGNVPPIIIPSTTPWNYDENYNKIYKAVASNTGITFYTYEPLTRSVFIKVIDIG